MCCFEQPGHLTLEHRTPARTYALAAIDVGIEPATPSLAEPFDHASPQPGVGRGARSDSRRIFEAPPDKTLALVAEMDLGAPEGPVVYACPMHPEVVSDQPGRCPKCGMTLMPTAAPSQLHLPDAPGGGQRRAGALPEMRHGVAAGRSSSRRRRRTVVHAHHGEPRAARGPREPRPRRSRAAHAGDTHAMHGGRPGASAAPRRARHARAARRRARATARAPRRNRRDRVGGRDGRRQPADHVGEHPLEARRQATGAASQAIDWRFRVGDKVKLRLVNETDSDHPMHHPFHVHGAGRFVVLARDGVPEANLVWKDTVLVRTGEDRGHPAGRHESRSLDGPLPHRRAPRERHDALLPRRSSRNRQYRTATSFLARSVATRSGPMTGKERNSSPSRSTRA